jgi:hypothetical protein
MKNVLKHSKTRLYLTRSGKLTASRSHAAPMETITAAAKLCVQLRLDIAEFIYQTVKA